MNCGQINPVRWWLLLAGMLCTLPAWSYDRSEHVDEVFLGYGAGSYTLGELDSMLGGVVNIGYDLDKVFSLEAQFGVTESDKQTRSGADVEVQMEHTSLFARANYRRNHTALYGMIGRTYTKTQSKALGNGFLAIEKETDSTSGIAYGVGADFFGSDTVAVNLKWLRLLDQDDTEVDAIFLGVTHYIGEQKKRIIKSKPPGKPTAPAMTFENTATQQ